MHPYPAKPSITLFAAASVLMLCSCVSAVDPAERFIREAQHRAAYWKARGYEFDPFLMSADTMDRHVENIERAAYWAARGFKFDPSKLSVFAMDRKAEAMLRAEYWRRWGIEFDSDMMDADTMDDAAVKLQKVRMQLKELERKNRQQPSLVIDKAAAEILSTPPQVKGGKVKAKFQSQSGQSQSGNMQNAQPSVAPITLGGPAVAGNSQARSQGSQAMGVPSQSGAAIQSGRRRSQQTGGSLQVPPGADPEEFFQYLRRLELGF